MASDPGVALRRLRWATWLFATISVLGLAALIACRIAQVSLGVWAYVLGYSWFMIVFVTLGCLLYRRDLRRRRDRGIFHRCRSCDYNLTGNVSGVCPECGHPFAKLQP